MSIGNAWAPVPPKAFLADAAITNRRVCVDGAASGDAKQAVTAGTLPPVGIARDTAADNAPVDVYVTPGTVAPACSGGVFSRGDPLTYDNTGKVIAATDGAEYLIGYAEDAAGGADVIVGVRICSPVKFKEAAVAVVLLTDNSAGAANDTIEAIPALATADLVDNTAGAANSTLEAIPDPTDAPATADALRDDLVAVHWPAIRNNFADLAAKINAYKAEINGTTLPALRNDVADLTAKVNELRLALVNAKIVTA